MTDDDRRSELRNLLRTHSLEHGEFTLSSGARSSYYIDARRTTMRGRGQLLIGMLGLAAVDEAGWRPAAVGGLTLGADPVAYAIAHAASRAGRTLDAFTVRKRAKEHGAGRRIEGAFTAGTDVVVTEDVVTTGESALRATRAVEGADARVLGLLALVDREQGGAARIGNEGYDTVALFTASELLGESE